MHCWMRACAARADCSRRFSSCASFMRSSATLIATGSWRVVVSVSSQGKRKVDPSSFVPSHDVCNTRTSCTSAKAYPRLMLPRATDIKRSSWATGRLDALMHCSRGVEQAASARSGRRRRGERVILFSFGSHMVAGVWRAVGLLG